MYLKSRTKSSRSHQLSKVEGADKLLQFRLDAGDSQDRQILSGIAEFILIQAN